MYLSLEKKTWKLKEIGKKGTEEMGCKRIMSGEKWLR